jgi:type II restriction enzyme
LTKYEIADVLELYDRAKQRHGAAAYRHISEILSQAKDFHKSAFLTTGKKDHEQSWKSFKGKAVEALVKHIVSKDVELLGLEIIPGSQLSASSTLRAKARKQLLINYGENGKHLPDVDLAIIDPVDGLVIAILSIKSTLRERVAQPAYWKLKLSNFPETKGIKLFLITLDEDEDLTANDPVTRNRAILESDIDCSYVMTQEDVQESKRVKMFDKFLTDLKLIYEERKKSVQEDAEKKISSFIKNEE